MDYRALALNGDVRIPDGITDVRGYEVRTLTDDEKVGKVNDLILGEDDRLRYLDVDTGGFFRPKHLLIPVGAAEVDRRNKVIWVSATKEQIDQLPDYMDDPASITDEYESRICGIYGTLGSDANRFDQDHFYGNRDDVNPIGESRGLDTRRADLADRVDASPRQRPRPDATDSERRL